MVPFATGVTTVTLAVALLGVYGLADKTCSTVGAPAPWGNSKTHVKVRARVEKPHVVSGSAKGACQDLTGYEQITAGHHSRRDKPMLLSGSFTHALNTSSHWQYHMKRLAFAFYSLSDWNQ